MTTTTGLNPRAGDLWVSFDGGWQGTRTIQALFDSTFGTASLTLYDNSLHIIGVSSPNATGAQLVFNGTTGSPYFLKISGTNNIVSLKVIESASINNVSQTVTGATSFVFTVTLSDPVAQAVTVAYATADGTATAASGDYVAQAGTLTFAAGVTSQPITIQITGDTNSAASETFFINLSAPTNVTLGTSKGIGTIVNGNASPGVTTTFASGASVAPAATPAAAPAVTPAASTTSTSSKAATVPMISPDPASSSKSKTTTSTDAALAEDEDWRLAALVA